MATAGYSDSDSSSLRNVPSTVPSSSLTNTNPYSAKDVVRDIERWVTSEGKLHSDVVKNIELKVNRQLSRWEETWIERQYVNIVLKIWLKESLEKAFSYLKNKAIDISTEMSALFHQLDSVNSFYDIPKQNVSSQLLSWCDGERFKLILKQTDPFQTNLFSVSLVSNYVNHLKNWCTDKVIARCLNDMAHSETNGTKERDFISALQNFFTTVHKNNTDDMQLQDIMEDESLEKDLIDDSISGKELAGKMLEKILKTKSVGPSSSKLEIRESFRRLKEIAITLEDVEWSPQLQTLTKETCKKSLLPITKAAIQDDGGGRRIIVVKGVSVSIGKMINKISNLQTKMKAHELQIIGLYSVHVDWSLTANDWHGINVIVVTDKLFVNGDVCWDVSGQHGTTQLEQSHQNGESGGNVLVVCNEIETIKDGRWTVVADGGDGSDGSNGPSTTTDNNTLTHKWSKENFKKYFPSMSTFSQHKSAMSTVLKTLDEILPSKNRDQGATKLQSHHENFYVECTAKDGSRITVSFLSKKNQVTKTLKKRCTLILCQGGRGGQGGYGGSITFEQLNGEPFAVPSSICVGTKKLPATEINTGVYQALQGKNGKAAGDVGFIHCVDITHGKKNKEGNYIGFDNDVKLKVEYLEHKPHDEVLNSYSPINPLHAEGNRYAKIIPKENQDTFESCHYSVMEEAGKKKKAIIRQSLEQYFVKIAERKRMAQSFHEIYSTNLSQTSLSQQLGDIESFVSQIENKQSLLQQQLTTQRVAEEKVGQGQYIKPAFIRRVHGKDIPNFRENMGMTSGCRPVDFQSKPKPPVDVRCLNLLPTMDGVDSALHSIYGKKNSTGIYLCRDPKRYREKIAEFIRSQEKSSQSGVIGSNCKIFNFIEQFVKWRVNYGDVDFPTASSMKDTYIKNTTSDNRESTQKFFKSLVDEYARFTESPSSTIDINEMEILAIDCDITVHIYESQLSSFKYKTTLNHTWSNDRSKAHFVLYERGGGWQRLEANEKLQNFCIDLDKQFFENSCSLETTYFSELIEWLGKNCPNKNIVTSIKKFNPLDGETPDELSQLLTKRLRTVFNVDPTQKKGKSNDEKIVQLAADLHFLSEIVLEYNNRNISHIFYLQIVSRFEPHEWKYEFLLLEIEQRLTNDLSYDEKNAWRKNLLYPLNDSVVCLLRERILATDKQHQINNFVFKSEERLVEKILKMLVKDLVDLTEVEITHLGNLPLSDWYYELRCKVWQKIIDSKSLVLKTRQEGKSLKRKALYMLLDLEMKRGEDYCLQLTNGIKGLEKVVQKLEEHLVPKIKTNRWNNTTKHLERKVSDIIFSMKNDSDNSFQRRLEDIGKKVEESKQMQLTGNQINDLISNEWLVKGIDMTDGPSLVKFLYVFDYAVREIFQKKGLFQLRDTQRVAIMTLLMNSTMVNLPADSGTLVQIATGEGKSLIVAGVAIAFALSRLPNADCQNKGKNKVDVITSNNILAYRDSHFSVDEGGLRNLYEFFKVNVNNNCSQSEYNRVKAYDSDVVYGELSNFQRDYLLDKFYNRNIRGDRTFDFVIVDEVDCMLLDRSNNTLYLSHDIPGMEMLESLYVFIWEKIHQSMEFDAIKSAVLFYLYGVITKDNLNSIHAPLKDHSSEKNALWNHLIEKKIIDSKGRLLIEDVDKITEKTIDYTSKCVHSRLNHHLTFFFRNVAKRERHPYSRAPSTFRGPTSGQLAGQCLSRASAQTGRGLRSGPKPDTQ